MTELHNFTPGGLYSGFRLKERAWLEEIKSTVLFFTHEALACPALAIKNTDANKTFCLSFATIPADSTGVAHIIEHSVLMGSEKYPVRDVFGEIHKGGLLTFLNAMTGPDCTYYPFATRNLKEYFNIMDVYCDVAFHPLLAASTFEQEGWRLHLEDENARLSIRGVVFNEMKGAFDDPLRALVQNVYKGLAPGSTYAHEAGGDPWCIPDLTYEAFKAFHRRHYHPSNCAFFFYGDAPLERELAFVQERVLSSFAGPGQKACCASGTAPTAASEIHDSYPVNEDPAEKTFLALAARVGQAGERKQHLAFELLTNILFNSDASPLKNAVIEAGLGKDFGGACLSGAAGVVMLLAYLIGARPEKMPAFAATCRECLQGLARDGLDPELVLSELNTLEFKLREEMNKPQRGLQLILRAQEAMKYGLSPLEALQVDNLLAALRQEALHEHFLERLMQTALLDNPAPLHLILEPRPKGPAENAALWQARLARMEAGLDQAARRELAQKTRALERLQTTAPTASELACLPRLSVKELDTRPPFFLPCASELAGRPLLLSELDTSGIVYCDLGFDCSALSAQDLLDLDLFGAIVTELGTGRKNYIQFAKELNRYTGGFSNSFHTYTQRRSQEVRPVFWLHVKALASFLEPALNLVFEALAGLDFSDRTRIEEIVRREFTWAEHSAHSEGYDLAASRAFALLGRAGQYSDAVQGMSAYLHLKELAADYKRHEEAFLQTLTRLKKALFVQSGLTCAVTADGPDIERFTRLAGPMLHTLASPGAGAQTPEFPALPRTQAFTTAAGITYNVQAARIFGGHDGGGPGYEGDFEVLKTWISRDYLWNAIRQVGGAYGCFAQFNPLTGNFGLVSYRDPQVGKTFAAYEQLAQAVARLDLPPAALEQLIIGAYASVNPHQGPAARGAQARDRYLCGLTSEFLQARIDAILGANVTRLRRYAPCFAAFSQKPLRVSLGNAAMITRESGLFDEICAL